MRSDLRDNTDTINKMIQFGTVKYGIVKQLKDRTRSERDLTSDQEEDGSSIACSPIAECKSTTPELPEETILNNSNHKNNEDHNHNNNISENHDDHHENNRPVKIEKNDTYPELELINKPAIPTIEEDQVEQQAEQTDQQQQQQEQPEHIEVDHPEPLSSQSPHDQDDLNMSEVEDDHENVQERNSSPHHKNDESSILENPCGGSGHNSPPPTLPQFPTTPMSLEAIQNMQIAIAQFATKTLANGGADNETAMKQLAFLQQTLFNLQQQQIFQMQLIQQLRSQLAMNQGGDNDQENIEDDEEIDEEEQNCAENLVTTNHKSEENQKYTSESMDVSINEDDVDIKDDDLEGMEEMEEGEIRLSERELHEQKSMKMNDHRIIQGDLSSLALPKQDENTPLPYGSDLASSIITNHDTPPSLNEPNSLEMLQKRAQEVLDSASQGILAGNLADEFAFGKDKCGDGKNRNEPFFKHRCRYCGKVFGSDSALQIHIRSHTGERPFKCNVCGSRFTTKGNLKVHFQRHAQKFPHVPMNSTPIPEHLDKFHPPLLEQMSPDSSPTHPSQMPQSNVPVSLPLPFPPGAGFPGIPLYRPPLEILKSLGPYSNPFFGPLPPMPPKRDQELPTDLRKPSATSSPNIKEEDVKGAAVSLRIKEEAETKPEQPTRPKSITPPPAVPVPRPPSPPSPQQQQQLQEQHQQQQQQQQLQQQQQQQPKEPQSQRSPHQPPLQHSLPPQKLPPPQQPTPMPLQLPPLPPLPPLPSLPPTSTHLPSSINREDLQDRLPLNFTRASPERRSPIYSPASIPRSPFLGPMKQEMTLLPRPHSNDNSWENFIEVSNTCETVKLKELMKNKKLTDPNQCVVCDRVLSCKSALQMHYRTHTGERPFKCRICGRAFTTKGNLKTHMAVHKIRPPMRNFHQCPVCHKKYSNALVLQQHIRLHTGEPTDLTPEQIQAAEIRDFPPSMVPGSFLNPFAFNFGVGGHNGTMGSESSQGDNDDGMDGMDCSDDFDDEDISDHMSNGGDFDRPKSRDDMKGMLFEQKLKIENNRPKSEASTSSAPTSPVSAINKSSPAPSDTSQGALDLTPRTSVPPPPNPMLFPQRPPFGMFPNLPLFPPVSSTTHNMCSAMNSIAQSVMPSAPFNPLALSGVRGSTTCGICFKTFPCHSALEIHYRSHTKERPFKCSICDRGFTTKGNLKQHMLTHKIRDMEQDAFRNRAIKYMNTSNWKEEFE